MEDNFNNINRVKVKFPFIDKGGWDDRYYQASTPTTPTTKTTPIPPAAALDTTIQSQSTSQRNCNRNARSSPSFLEMKFVAPAVSRNMNSLIFLTTDMHHNDCFTTCTTTGPESPSGTTSTALTRPQQSTATTTASIRMVPSKASQRSRSIVNAATAIARADANHYNDHDHGHEDHHEDLAASTVSATSQHASAGSAGGNGGRAMSQSMPFPSSHVHRTASEVQLCEDEEMAEQRDLTMFYRLVNGIRERQIHHQNPDCSIGSIDGRGGSGVAGTVAAGPGLESFPIHHLPPPSHYYGEPIPQGNQGAAAACALETERSLAHIIQTRNSKLEDAPPPGPATAALQAEGAPEWSVSGYGNDQVAAPIADRSSLAPEVHPAVREGDMYSHHHTPPPTATNMMPMMSSAYDAEMDHRQYEDPVAATEDGIDDDDDEGIFDMEL